jgi:glycerophosphoryl diester phosphodiesterase
MKKTKRTSAARSSGTHRPLPNAAEIFFGLQNGSLRQSMNLSQKRTDNNRFNPPWLIAHRGFRAKYPENTLVAFQAALDAGCPMIELDVTLSRDRKLVVIHDATLDRTTDGRGAVRDHTLTELKQLDAGSWFHPMFAGQRLPELTEVLELVDGRAFINIEIKTHAYEPHHPPDAIEKQIVALVEQKQVRETILISSFDIRILEQLLSVPASPVLALLSQHRADSHTVKLCEYLKAYSWNPAQHVLTRQQVKRMHAVGIRVFPYNVDTPADYRRMRAINVDGVITDDPFIAVNGSRS